MSERMRLAGQGLAWIVLPEGVTSPYVWISECNPDVIKDRANIWVDDNIGMSNKFSKNQHTSVTPGFLSISGYGRQCNGMVM
jgi:hypothetical protein